MQTFAVTNFWTDIHVASFFSDHRPISVTSPFPTPSSEVVFSNIFQPVPSTRPQPSDIIYTISSAVDTLENQGSPQQQALDEESDLRTAITQASSTNAEPKHLDSKPLQAISVNIQELAKNFRPFVVPPAPVPIGQNQHVSATETIKPTTRRHKYSSAPKEKSYTTVLTITERTHPNGRKTYQAQTSPIREEPFSPKSSIPEEPETVDITPPSQQPFLNRMRIRHKAWEERLKGGKPEVWRMISVKRQRKLKMKKHKYKKLMRRTRTLRKKLDRN